MLSISKPKSASAGLSYFQADSYYAGDEGSWIGKGAESLGLGETLSKREFNMILKGRGLSGDALVKNTNDGRRRSYVDFTFSAPKSVSILSYSDSRIEAAHNKAVQKTIQELEKNYCITREGAGGTYSYRTGNVIAARFNHHESRELDPQLHSHCVLMNMTKGRDGKFRSIEMSQMFKNKMYLGQMYRNELAIELSNIGYGIKVTERSKGLFELAGVEENVISEFSTRRKQVLEAKAKYEKFSVSDAEKAAMACLDSRKYKKKHDIDEIREITERKLEEFGTSLKKVREEALKEIAPVKKLTPGECLNMAMADITESQSAFTRESAINLAMKNGLGVYSRETLEGVFNSSKEIQYLGSKNVMVGKTVSPNVDYFTTNDIVNIETGIVLQAERLAESSPQFVDSEKVKKVLDWRTAGGTNYSEGQRKAIEMMCTSKSFLNICQGDAGAGKTFAVETFREIVNESGFVVRGFAPTAKAAVELQSAKIETSTVDSFLLSKKQNIGKSEIWVVDESGMMGSRKLAKFLHEAEKFGAKVVLIGDSKQFAAVEQGKMFADLQAHLSSKNGYAEITEVRRQKTAHMINVVSDFKKKTADGVQAALAKMQNSNLIQQITDRVKRLSAVATDYLNDRSNGVNTIVLTATNNDRNDLNANIRTTLVSQGIVSEGYQFQTLQTAGVSGNNRRFADSYRKGQQIFLQKDVQGIKPGTQAEIIKADPGNNVLTIEYTKKKTEKKQQQQLDLFQAADRIQTFNRVEKQFGIGDSVITLKNDKLLGVANGKIGTIKNIDENGNVSILFDRKDLKNIGGMKSKDPGKSYLTAIFEKDIGDLKAGQECRIVGHSGKKNTFTIEYSTAKNAKKHKLIAGSELAQAKFYQDKRSEFSLKNYPYLDHAYAVTSYKSQGATVEQVRWVHDHTKPTNYNEAYVAITRAKIDAMVYTSNTSELIQQASKEQKKESVLYYKSQSNATEKPVGNYQSDLNMSFDDNLIAGGFEPEPQPFSMPDITGSFDAELVPAGASSTSKAKSGELNLDL